MENTPASPSGAAPAKPIPLSPWWLVFAALALAVPLGAFLFRAANPARVAPLPVLSVLPDFQLVDQGGRPFARKDLLGRTWVADFVFTRCVDACPRLTATMKQVQDSLPPEQRAEKAGLLSISVDPLRDTPAVLRTYAEAHGADPRLWHFLTGDPAQIERAVVQGFKSGYQAAGPQNADDKKADDSAEAFDIMHGEKFVLVDADGRIRGYYDVNEAPELQRLLHDLAQLIRGEQ